jgi:hypothetical protein
MFFKLYSKNIPLDDIKTEAEDVANSLIWISSSEASFCNGEILKVDGGYELTAANYQDYSKKFVMPEKQKLELSHGMMPVARSKYDAETMGHDADDPDHILEAGL